MADLLRVARWLGFGHWFGTSPEFWLNLQTRYELRLAREAVDDSVSKLPRLCHTSATR
jgi:plasmid maintenance system antidote protein VapI